MEFALSDIVTYNEYYARESHKFIPLHTIADLEGFPKIAVRIHDLDALSEEQEVLQKQVEALAAFGMIRIVYVDEEGIENKFYDVMKPVTENKQREVVFTDTPYTEEQVKALMDSEEGGCSGGACTI